jgi:DNA adenine methylase
MALRPLIKWSGGKSEELNYIVPHVPDFDRYIEPFIGGGALYFHLAPTILKSSKNAVIADVHTELLSFYNEIKAGNGDKITQFMDTNFRDSTNREHSYYAVRGKKCTNTIDIASRFYFLRKTCYRGMLRYNSKGEFNIPYGRYKTCDYSILTNPEYIPLFKQTDIQCTDFDTIFSTYNSSHNFVFLDPPYDSKFTDYGYCKFEKTDQERLAERFKKTRNQCLMVIGDTDFIRSLYEEYIVEEYEKKYSFKLHSGRITDKINNLHLVIKNY